jgi:hypothetical protein
MKETPDMGRRASGFGPEFKTRMGQQLRVMYGDVMNQGVPDCHHELLQQLEAADGRASGGCRA